MKKNTCKYRLQSLDILRGIDLFLLCFLQPIVYEMDKLVDWQWLHAIAFQLDHEAWDGFRFWDLVMPLFLFMAGTAMPFSLGKYQYSRKYLYYKVTRRFIILFLLGMVVQGNLLGFDTMHLYIYVNTLQAIAVGYVIATVVLTEFQIYGQLMATILLLIAYWLPMTWWGDYSMEGNLACRIDAAVLGRFRGDPSYSWLLSSFTFGVTTLLGAFAGEIIKNNPGKRNHVPLFVIGIALVIFALIWSIQMPIIKRIWTCSMVLLSGGYCYILLALLYYLVDYGRKITWLSWFNVYGMNSIAAYCMAEFIDFRSIVHSLCYGLQPMMGDFYSVLMTFGNYLVVFLILRFMYVYDIYIKI